MTVDLFPVRSIGLTDDEKSLFEELLKVWNAKRSKNALLSVYYDGHRAFHDLGISIPPQMKNLRAALGWPAKGVRTLARKHQFEGFALGGEVNPFGIDELLEKNNFGLELPQAINSAYKHAVSFITTTKGDTSAGDPDVVIQARDAEWTSALWDKRRREVKAALAITDADDLKMPVDATLFFRDVVVTVHRSHGVWKVVTRQENPTNRVLVEPFVNDPQIGRPFGYSRITREVRYLTDAAIRNLVRTEVSAEFFASPQRYVLGAREDAFNDVNRWSAVMSRMLALDVNEEGQIPQVGQFTQMTMSPHLEQYRQLAQNFCSETDLPASAVGLFADNPASAEAMQAAEARLSDVGEYQWRVFRNPLKRIAQNIVMLRDGLVDVPDESWKLDVKWTPCRYVSPQASSDYITKVVAALPKVAETTTALRRAGFTQEEINEMQAEWSRAGAGSILDRVLAARGAASDQAEPSVPGGATS